MTNDKKNSALRSPWVYTWIALVIVVLAVNITMIMFSKDKNPGLVVDDFYERGQDYEENMAEKLKKNLQWKSEYQITEPLVLNKPSTIGFKLENTEVKDVKVDKVTLYVYRPADAKLDFNVNMTQGDDKTSTAQVTFPAKGLWDLLVSVTVGEEEFNFGKRVFIKEK